MLQELFLERENPEPSHALPLVHTLDRIVAEGLLSAQSEADALLLADLSLSAYRSLRGPLDSEAPKATDDRKVAGGGFGGGGSLRGEEQPPSGAP